LYRVQHGDLNDTAYLKVEVSHFLHFMLSQQLRYDSAGNHEQNRLELHGVGVPNFYQDLLCSNHCSSVFFYLNICQL